MDNEDNFTGFVVESLEDDTKGVLYYLKLVYPIGSITSSVAIAPYFKHKQSAQDYAKSLNKDLQAGYHPQYGYPSLPPLCVKKSFFSFGKTEVSETHYYAEIVGEYD